MLQSQRKRVDYYRQMSNERRILSGISIALGGGLLKQDLHLEKINNNPQKSVTATPEEDSNY